MTQASLLLPVLFGLVAVLAVIVYPNRAARPKVAIAMGIVVLIVSGWSGLTVARPLVRSFLSSSVRPAPLPVRAAPAVFPPAFSATLTGKLVRRGGDDEDSAATWWVQSTVQGELTGTLDVTLAGRPASNRGLSVDTGTLVLRSGQGAVCNATFRTIRNNNITASCNQSRGGPVNLRIQFAVGNSDAVTGHLSGSLTSAAAQLPSPSSGSRVSGGSAAHVFVIVLENRSYASALGTPYLSSLARQYALAVNYHSVAEPSLPNYLALTSGSTWNITDDGYHRLPATGLGAQLSAAGLSWTAYAEGFSGDCFSGPYPYALKHNPFAYYGGGCTPNVVPFSQLAGDLAGTTPNLSWIMPGLCNDGHDCSAATTDSWLAMQVPAILASAAWRQGGVLFITFDEGGNANDDHVATLVIAPTLVAHRSSHFYNHYSLLATIEDRLGVGRLGEAAQASPMADLVK